MRDLPWHEAPICPVCALPTPGNERCGTCLRHPPAFDGTHATLAYQFPADAILRRYKYSGLLAVADLAGKLMAKRLAQHTRPDLLIPMPLHPSRLQERGFNQAAEIARVISKEFRIPLISNACSRARQTVPQAGLSLEERRRNLRGAFACSLDLTGKHVVLLDDVMTTGASLDELARTVKKSGAVRVDCWVAARTLKRD